jgi:adenine-specific DNA-methyltransferase
MSDKPEAAGRQGRSRAFEVTRTELVWPGKYDARGNLVEPPRLSLPFRVTERVEQAAWLPRDPKQALLPLYEDGPPAIADKAWRNKLICGDNLLVEACLRETFAGKIDLVYIDPPFATGADFSFTTIVGDGDPVAPNQPSSVEFKAYGDTWARGKASFLRSLWPRLQLMRDLLRDTGLLFAHFDDNIGHEVKLLLDDVFGTANYRGEIVWQLGTGAKSRKFFSIQHNIILIYSKGDTWQFHADAPELREPFAQTSLGTHFRNVDSAGRRYRKRVIGGKEYIYYADQGRMVGSVWTDISSMTANSPIIEESTGYPTQKPEKLLRRILSACTSTGDLVADFYSGSGTVPVVAEKLGRRWIACDLGISAIHTTRKRLLTLRKKHLETGKEPGCQPFELLELGRCELRYWLETHFGSEPDCSEQPTLAAYVRFILDLYQARPFRGVRVHGKKGAALVHVAAVDAEVTASQIADVSAEAVQLGGKELHVLGWEFEIGLADPTAQRIRSRDGLVVRLIRIPREAMEGRAVEAGKVQFMDLPCVTIEVLTEKSQKSGRTIQLGLKDYVIAGTDLVPKNISAKIKKWSDYIDYWAVDWDFREDTFTNQWQSYRTRQDRSLALSTPVHGYDAPRAYQIMVKVVDIFGQDTSHLIAWENQ